MTLLSSRSSENVCIVEILSLYYFCTETLEERMKRFNKSDDIYSGIECALEKLNHYYDKISPMVGIALILNPSMKKDFLRDSLCWKEEWVNTVMDQFHSSFNYYKRRVGDSTLLSSVASTNPRGDGHLSEFAEFRKRKRAANSVEDEFTRYIIT